ncbi:MAG: GAF domain-containing protein [Dehalococcoidia bacterium]
MSKALIEAGRTCGRAAIGINHAAASLGIPTYRLRNWDKEGLIVTGRDAGGARTIGFEELGRIATALELQKLLPVNSLKDACRVLDSATRGETETDLLVHSRPLGAPPEEAVCRPFLLVVRALVKRRTPDRYWRARFKFGRVSGVLVADDSRFTIFFAPGGPILNSLTGSSEGVIGDGVLLLSGETVDLFQADTALSRCIRLIAEASRASRKAPFSLDLQQRMPRMTARWTAPKMSELLESAQSMLGADFVALLTPSDRRPNESMQVRDFVHVGKSRQAIVATSDWKELLEEGRMARSGRGTIVRVGQGLVWETWANGTSRIWTEREISAEAVVPMREKSALTSLVQADRNYGVLYAGSFQRDNFTSDELTTLDMCAALVASEFALEDAISRVK